MSHGAPRSHTVLQKGEIRATACGLAGSSSWNANAGSVGTLSTGGDGGVEGSVKSRNAPPNAGRQCAPVSSSIVIGAPCGTSGTSGNTTFWRRTVSIGSSTPTRRATSPEKGPAATTTDRVATVPLV